MTSKPNPPRPNAPRSADTPTVDARTGFSKQRAARFYAALASDRPAPGTELDYTDPYTLLVAVVLSAQSTDVGVNKATKRLFALADTPDAMVVLGEAQIREAIRTLGLFNAKARNVLELSRILVERHGGRVPTDRAALEALPGVGRKTANVVLNEAFGAPTLAVDTHIFRVANRTGLAPGKTPRAVEEGLLRITPKRYLKGAHHWLILHGRYTCRARAPFCGDCPVRPQCGWPDKTDLNKPEGSTAQASAADPPDLDVQPTLASS